MVFRKFKMPIKAKINANIPQIMPYMFFSPEVRLPPMVNTPVKRRDVNTIAKIPMRFLLFFTFNVRSAIFRMIFLFFTLFICFTILYNLSIFNTDDAVCHLSNFFIVGYHNHSLPKCVLREALW